MNETTTTRHPKRKRQPTAECMRQQLALAADEIISLRMRLLAFMDPDSNYKITYLRSAASQLDEIVEGPTLHFRGLPFVPEKARPWWRRMLGRWFV